MRRRCYFTAVMTMVNGLRVALYTIAALTSLVGLWGMLTNAAVPLIYGKREWNFFGMLREMGWFGGFRTTSTHVPLSLVGSLLADSVPVSRSLPSGYGRLWVLCPFFRLGHGNDYNAPFVFVLIRRSSILACVSFLYLVVDGTGWHRRPCDLFRVDSE